ncbi:hypothetical protein EMIHUDRAFT_435775, partial [Emiliania huxleyi CCMP1516]|uniref:Uncharacterized protein n=2 Tax=Emiliania huxleyi TaxID=2903 RepID=A0A0D3JBT7_EMIH1
ASSATKHGTRPKPRSWRRGSDVGDGVRAAARGAAEGEEARCCGARPAHRQGAAAADPAQGGGAQQVGHPADPRRGWQDQRVAQSLRRAGLDALPAELRALPRAADRRHPRTVRRLGKGHGRQLQAAPGRPAGPGRDPGDAPLGRGERRRRRRRRPRRRRRRARAGERRRSRAQQRGAGGERAGADRGGCAAARVAYSRPAQGGDDVQRGSSGEGAAADQGGGGAAAAVRHAGPSRPACAGGGAGPHLRAGACKVRRDRRAGDGGRGK